MEFSRISYFPYLIARSCRPGLGWLEDPTTPSLEHPSPLPSLSFIVVSLHHLHCHHLLSAVIALPSTTAACPSPSLQPPLPSHRPLHRRHSPPSSHFTLPPPPTHPSPPPNTIPFYGYHLIPNRELDVIWATFTSPPTLIPG